MVRSITVLSVCLAFIVSQVSAEASPSMLVRDLSNQIQARQGFSLPPGSFPDSCQTQCTSVVNSISGCAAVSCICSNSVGSGLQSCMNCAVGTSTSVDRTQAQTVLDQFVQSCKSAGSPIKPLTLGAASASGTGKKNGAIGLRSGMAMGAGAFASVAGILYVL